MTEKPMTIEEERFQNFYDWLYTFRFIRKLPIIEIEEARKCWKIMQDFYLSHNIK
jgi:hypothetical protein